MNALTTPVHAYPVIAYALLACLFGWAFFLAAALGADLSPGMNPLGPFMAAAAVTALLGRTAWRTWGRQLSTLRTSVGWYALAFTAPIVIMIAAVFANYSLGAPLPTAEQLAGWVDLPVTFVFLLIAIGIGEEAGWTAFAAPRLLERYPFMTAWFGLATIRVIWHLPLMLEGDLPWVLGIGGNAAFQFLLLWIFQRSGGAWFLAAIWHGVLNTVGGEFFFRLLDGPDQGRLGVLMTAGYVLFAAAVLVFDRVRLIDERREAERREPR